MVVFLVLIKLIKLKLFCWTTMTLFIVKICIKILIVTMWSQLYCICSILFTAIFLVWKQIHSILNQSTTSIIYIMCTFKCFKFFFELARGLCFSLFIHITFQLTPESKRLVSAIDGRESFTSWGVVMNSVVRLGGVSLRIGVPASPLTNRHWPHCFKRRNVDLFCLSLAFYL